MRKIKLILCIWLYIILSSAYPSNAQEYPQPAIIIPYLGHVVAWSPDESQILTVDYWSTYTAYVFDANSGDLVLSIPHERLVWARWNKDATQIMTWGFDGYIRLWDAETGVEMLVIDNGVPVERAEWNNDETLILSSGLGAYLWDAQTGNELFSLDGNYAVWSNNYSQILTWGSQTDFVVWDVESGEEHIKIDIPDACFACAIWDSDNHQILLQARNTAQVWDSESGLQTAMMPHDTALRDALWSPNREQVLTIARDNFARLWDAQTGDLLFSFEHAEQLDGAKWNNDGTQFLTWTFDETISVWDALTGEKILELKYGDRYEFPGTDVTWSQDQTKIYQLATDSSLRIWDAQTGDLLAVLRQHNENGEIAPEVPPTMAWNADETRVVTTFGGVNIWNMDNILSSE